MKKEKVCTLLICTALLGSANAQKESTVLLYGYNQSGCRTSRTFSTVTLRSSSAMEVNQEDAKPEDPVSDQLEEEVVFVYPNPVKDHLYIKIEKNDNQNYKYLLYNLSGETLSGGEIGASGEHSLPMNSYAAGTYMLQVQKADKKIFFKIIKE